MNSQQKVYRVEEELFGYTEQKQKTTKDIRVSNILKIISLCLSIFPLVLILYCVIASKGEGEDGAGAIMWLVILYYWSLGVPVAIAAVVTGVISFLKRKNIAAVISVILALLPFMFILGILK